MLFFNFPSAFCHRLAVKKHPCSIQSFAFDMFTKGMGCVPTRTTIIKRKNFLSNTCYFYATKEAKIWSCKKKSAGLFRFYIFYLNSCVENYAFYWSDWVTIQASSRLLLLLMLQALTRAKLWDSSTRTGRGGWTGRMAGPSLRPAAPFFNWRYPTTVSNIKRASEPKWDCRSGRCTQYSQPAYNQLIQLPWADSEYVCVYYIETGSAVEQRSEKSKKFTSPQPKI